MNQDRRNNPNPRSLIIQQKQLGCYVNVEKTTYEEWIKDGKLRYFRAKPGGTKYFCIKHLEEDIERMYNNYHSYDTYEVGGG